MRCGHRHRRGTFALSLEVATVLGFALTDSGGREAEAAIREFVRGDTDANGALEITDAIRVLNVLFLGGEKLRCLSAADSNDDGALDISDGIYLLGFLFLGGPRIPEPHGRCGTDPTPDELDCLESACGFVPDPSVVLRSASLVEDLRGSDMAPGWEEAFVGEDPVPLYLPGLPGVAYWEFPVWVSDPDSSRLLPAGSVILSDGDGDSPVSSFRDGGKAFARILAEEAKSRGKSAARFFFVDVGAYAAEDETGALVATVGRLPLKVAGLRREWLDASEETKAVWEMVPRPNDPPEFRLVQTGPGFSDAIRFEEWSSWEDLKEGYGRSYGVLLEAARRDARSEWDVETLAEASGDGLRAGETFRLPLVPKGATYLASGEGTRSTRFEVVERPGGARVLEITPLRADPERELPFEIGIFARAGQTEVEVLRRRFAILPGNGEGAGGGDWGPWTVYWAGTHGNQRCYDQFAVDGCASGCGPTAWAMLFGWVDVRASLGDATWAPHWGIYRVDGGYGADAVAPGTTAWGAANMIREIRGYVDTFCLAGEGATLPGHMHEAQEYIAGRDSATISCYYDSCGIARQAIRNDAIASIAASDTPAVLGTGCLQHYPLAYGYARRSRTVKVGCCWETVEYQRRFYVNQGWGCEENGWIVARAWFSGRIRP